jgi:hypothetical protein
MSKIRPKTPGREPEAKLSANELPPEVPRISAAYVHKPLLSQKFDVNKISTSPLLESFPYEDYSLSLNLSMKTISTPPRSSSSNNPLWLLFSGT